MKKPITVFAPSTATPGELRQIKGLANCLSRRNKDALQIKFSDASDIRVDNIIGRVLKRSDYNSYDEFKTDMNICLDNYFSTHILSPDYFIMAYTQADNEKAELNIDATCQVVKEYYQKNEMGNVTTIVLTSKLHDYKYADVVQIPSHLMNDEERANFDGNEKVYVSIGIIHNLSLEHIKNEQKQEKAAAELKKFDNGKPKVVFGLGGRVHGPEIGFDVNVAKKLYDKAVGLEAKGYDVIFVNSSRTPNEVSDYLYEKSIENPKVHFYNTKPVAANDAERVPNKWRIYSGKYEKEFKQELDGIGSMYLALLGMDNTLVVQTYDSYAACETTSMGIPTAIFRGFYIDEKVRPDCYRLAKDLIDGGYAIDFSDFDGRIYPKDLRLNVLPMVNDEFSEIVVKIHQNK